MVVYIISGNLQTLCQLSLRKPFFMPDPNQIRSADSVRTRMEDSVINQMNSIIHSAEKFIDELAEDLKRLNQNTDTLTQKSMDSVNRYLDPMAKALQANPTLSTGEAKKIEENIVIDTEATTV